MEDQQGVGLEDLILVEDRLGLENDRQEQLLVGDGKLEQLWEEDGKLVEQ